MFAPMSSGRETWQDEPEAPQPGRFRAHAPARSLGIGPSVPGPSTNKPGLAGLRDIANLGGLGLDGPKRPSYAPAQARRRERLRNRVDSTKSTGGSGFTRRGATVAGARNRPKRWYMNAFRPTREVVDKWLESWWMRWGILAAAPSVTVWIWCAMPFPKTTESWYKPETNPGISSLDCSAIWANNRNSSSAAGYCTSAKHLSPSAATAESTAVAVFTSVFSRLASSLLPFFLAGGDTTAPRREEVDADFWFFLIFYYGIYCAVALVYITQLFSLYRLNWWPKAVGAKTSYTFFWVGSLVAGYILHRLDLLRSAEDGSGSGGEVPAIPPVEEDDVQWQRKTLWIGLAFATMAMPALVCLAGLRRSGRQTYRHSLTDMQKSEFRESKRRSNRSQFAVPHLRTAFLERQLARRIPASYIRFLWFSGTIGMALFALVAGQGYASVYLSTLPHTSLESTAYVTFWMTTVNLLAIVSHWVLEEKVRSRALLFVFKYYYFLVYFIFYRNLFARLNSGDQFAFVQLLSSFWVCIWYPFSMTTFCHRVVNFFTAEPKSWEEYVESVGLAFYLRNLAQNTTMIAFLGWVSILHFGSNRELYPFFAFDDKRDPYNYQLTMIGSAAIWASELLSSWVARELCKYAFQVDVTNLGLDEMREYPEIVPTCVWTSIHVLMDMLLFLLKLNFR